MEPLEVVFTYRTQGGEVRERLITLNGKHQGGPRDTNGIRKWVHSLPVSGRAPWPCTDERASLLCCPWTRCQPA